MHGQPDKTSIHVKTDCSNEMKALLLQSRITKDIASSYPSMEQVMLQVQRDTVATGNDEEILQVIKGLKKLDNVLKMFAVEGKNDLR